MTIYLLFILLFFFSSCVKFLNQPQPTHSALSPASFILYPEIVFFFLLVTCRVILVRTFLTVNFFLSFFIVETSRTKFIDEEITPAPRRRLIKADFHLHLSSSFDDEEEGDDDGDGEGECEDAQTSRKEEAIDANNENITPTHLNDSNGIKGNSANDSEFGHFNDECKDDDRSLDEDSSSTDDVFDDAKQKQAIKIRRKKRASDSNGNSVGVRGTTTKASIPSSMPQNVATNINSNSSKAATSVTSRFGSPQVEPTDAKFGKKFNLKSCKFT